MEGPERRENGLFTDSQLVLFRCQLDPLKAHLSGDSMFQDLEEKEEQTVFQDDKT